MLWLEVIIQRNWYYRWYAEWERLKEVLMMTSISFYLGTRKRVFAHPCYWIQGGKTKNQKCLPTLAWNRVGAPGLIPETGRHTSDASKARSSSHGPTEVHDQVDLLAYRLNTKSSPPVIFRCISTKLGDIVYILLFKSYAKFHAKLHALAKYQHLFPCILYDRMT